MQDLTDIKDPIHHVIWSPSRITGKRGSFIPRVGWMKELACILRDAGDL